MTLLHKELTFDLRKYMIEVHNEIGVDFDEETYGLNSSVGDFFKEPS